MSPDYPHLRDVYAEYKLHPSDRNRVQLPYSENELQWLESFLKACDFMTKMNGRSGDHSNYWALVLDETLYRPHPPAS